MIAIPNMDKPKSCIECFLQDECEHNKDTYWIHEERPHDCPLIDIVQCKDCIWSYTDERDGLLWWKVHLHHYRVNTDDFCSYGERELFGISERLKGEANDR